MPRGSQLARLEAKHRDHTRAGEGAAGAQGRGAQRARQGRWPGRAS